MLVVWSNNTCISHRFRDIGSFWHFYSTAYLNACYLEKFFIFHMIDEIMGYVHFTISI